MISLFYIFSTEKLTYMSTPLLVLSSFRTTATDGLPNLSFIKRKPEPLGTEFKNLVDGLSGQMIWLDIQEGVSRMPKKEFSKMGGTAAYVLRGVKASQDLHHIPLHKTSMDIDIE